MAQTPLTLHEREEIGIALRCNPDESWAVMGRQCGRHPTTIRREVTANGGSTPLLPRECGLASEQEQAATSCKETQPSRTTARPGDRRAHARPFASRDLGRPRRRRRRTGLRGDDLRRRVLGCARTEGHGVPATWATPTTVSPAATRQQANGDRDDREPAR